MGLRHKKKQIKSVNLENVLHSQENGVLTKTDCGLEVGNTPYHFLNIELWGRMHHRCKTCWKLVRGGLTNDDQ